MNSSKNNNKSRNKLLGMLFNNNFSLKIIALGGAILLWLIISIFSVDDIEVSIYNIKLDVAEQLSILEPKGMVLLDVPEVILSIKVKGSRADLMELSADDFVANIDISDVIEPRAYVLPITVESYENKPNYIISETKPNVIKVVFEREIVKTVPVTTAEEGSIDIQIAEGFLAQDFVYNPSEVTIRGAESVVEKIEKVYFEPKEDISEEKHENNYKINGDLKYLDKSDDEVDLKNIEVSDTSGTLTIPVHKEKELDIIINVIGKPDKFPEEAFVLNYSTVLVSGSKTDIDKISAIYLNVPIHEIGLDFIRSFDITEKEIPSALDNILGISEITAQLNIPNLIEKTINIANSNISIENMPLGYEVVLVTDRINNVTLIGDEYFLEKLSVNDVTAVIDCSAIPSSQLVEGQITVEAQITVIADGLAWSNETHNVIISLKKEGSGSN